MNSISLLLLFTQNSNTYETSTNVGAGLAAWSIINLVILLGGFILALLFVLKVIKYLNLKIKLMQKELDKN